DDKVQLKDATFLWGSGTFYTTEKLKELFGEKIKYNYKVYEPEADKLKEIKAILKSKNEQLKIIAFGADWCPDCHKNVPHMIKLIKRMKTNDVELRILYGIMVNALRKPGETLWHKTRSPPGSSKS
ncbi:unnamed protein product, partial [marine sediment metagenome]